MVSLILYGDFIIKRQITLIFLWDHWGNMMYSVFHVSVPECIHIHDGGMRNCLQVFLNLWEACKYKLATTAIAVLMCRLKE